ncbi:MAG: regulatory domain of in-like proprotein convertase, partial [Actinomycetia bacterium]|nr:regulatory domain of in-like proprotein convertase [Actinomycetes bacterium]
MRPAPIPALSPAEQTGDRPKIRAVAAARKARSRRAALEFLEPRALMAVLPTAPYFDPQIPIDKSGLDTLRRISNDGPSNPGNDSSPQITVDRYNPNKLVAVWTDHDILGNPEPVYTIRGATSSNGGLTWTALAGLPGVRDDPSTGTNPHAYNTASRPTVAFDGKDNFYVLTVQQNADNVTAGDVILKPYNFSGATPVGQPAATVYQWNRAATVPITKAVRDVTMVVDDNLPSFTDPVTGAVQTDIGAGRIYIAWETDDTPPSGYVGPWSPNTIEVLTSVNGGASFGAPVPVDVGHFQNFQDNTAPRLTVSQGRPAGTNGATDLGVPGGQVTVVFDDIVGGRNSNPVVDIIWATALTPTATGLNAGTQARVGVTTVLGSANSPYGSVPVAAAGTFGVGPAPVIASDNTLGSFSAHQGRIYVAFVDRYDGIRFPGTASNNPADNTDVFLKFSDDGGKTWSFAQTDANGRQLPVNDDDALTDGFSSASNKPSSYVTGRPQFLPAIAVDPATGTLAVSYLDTRFDASKTRTVDSIQISGDGGSTWSASTHANADVIAYDQTIQRDLALGPIPSNQVLKPDAAVLSNGEAGDRQGLALYDGRLYAAFVTNVNGGSDTFRTNEIHVAPMLYRTGPKVISSTMGLVGKQTVTDLATGLPIIFNDKLTADGTPIVEGFVITFDRPIDAATFTKSDVSVTYRDPFTSGASVGIPMPITSDPIPLSTGPTTANAGGTTRFLVRFAPQSNVGTYSYAIGPDVRDLSRNTVVTNYYYAGQSAGNLPAIPPTGSGGSGVPAQDQAKSTRVIAGVPVSQNILDIDVLVSIQHPKDSDLVLKLIPPPGYLPVGGPQFISLVAAGTNLGGADFTDTIFDDQARASIAAGTAPYTGHFRPSAALSALIGKSPNGTWTLEIDDNTPGNAGKLLSWGLKITTSNRSFDGNFTQAGIAALSPNVGATGGLISPGHLMDQDGDGIGGRNPNAGGLGAAGSVVVGLAPGDIYAAPTPNPTSPAVFNGQNINPPFAPTTLPLMISGPHVVRSFVPGAAAKTADNLVTDAQVNGFDIVFDRDMDPNTIVIGNHVARFATPYGTF